MTVLTASLLGVLTLLSATAYRRRGDRYWLALGALAGGGFALSVWRYGIEMGFPVTIVDVLIGLVVAFATVEVVGLPTRIAVQLGVGLRSRHWEYDRSLTALLHPLNVKLAERPDGESPVEEMRWRADVLRDGRARLLRLGRLQPPDDEWRAMTKTYADIYRIHLDAIANYDSDVDPRWANAMTETADQERERLREQYRLEAGSILAASRLARFLRRRD